MITAIFIFLLAFAFVGGIYFVKKKEAGAAVSFTILGIIVLITAISYWGRNVPKEMSLEKFSIKIEIRQSVINDSITKSDTVYIFIPKNDK